MLMMVHVRKSTIAAAMIALWAASCAPVQEFGSAISGVGGQTYPPDRAAWSGLPEPARIAHARTLHLALSSTERGPFSWTAANVSGSVTILDAKTVGDTLCIGFQDQIIDRAQIRDIACWGDGWFLVRRPDGIAVLAPAFAETDKVYTVGRRTTLKRIAKRTGVSLRELQALNPGHPRRLRRGTKILLP